MFSSHLTLSHSKPTHKFTIHHISHYISSRSHLIFTHIFSYNISHSCLTFTRIILITMCHITFHFGVHFGVHNSCSMLWFTIRIYVVNRYISNIVCLYYHTHFNTFHTQIHTQSHVYIYTHISRKNYITSHLYVFTHMNHMCRCCISLFISQ